MATGPGEHRPWCWRGAEEHDAYIAARVAEAQAWGPAVKLANLSPDDRAELNRIFDRRLQRREERHAFSVMSSGAPRNGERDRAYGLKVLDNECWRVARTEHGNRNNTLASASFKVGQRVGAGYLDHDEAFSNLLGAALDCGLSEREARPVIRSGLSAGARKPKDAT